MEDLIKGELDWHNKVNENFHEVDSQMADIAKNYFVNPKFPPAPITQAKGDGVTNDSASINGCLSFLSQRGGGCLFFPNGIYITDGIVIKYPDFNKDNKKLMIMGESPNTLLKHSCLTTKHVIDVTGEQGTPVNTNRVSIGIVNMSIDGVDNNKDGIHLYKVAGIYFNNITIKNCNYNLYGTGLSEMLINFITLINGNIEMYLDGQANALTPPDTNDCSSIQINFLWIIRWSLYGILLNHVGNCVFNGSSLIADSVSQGSICKIKTDGLGSCRQIVFNDPVIENNPLLPIFDIETTDKFLEGSVLINNPRVQIGGGTIVKTITNEDTYIPMVKVTNPNTIGGLSINTELNGNTNFVLDMENTDIINDGFINGINDYSGNAKYVNNQYKKIYSNYFNIFKGTVPLGCTNYTDISNVSKTSAGVKLTGKSSEYSLFFPLVDKEIQRLNTNKKIRILIKYTASATKPTNPVTFIDKNNTEIFIGSGIKVGNKEVTKYIVNEFDINTYNKIKLCCRADFDSNNYILLNKLEIFVNSDDANDMELKHDTNTLPTDLNTDNVPTGIIVESKDGILRFDGTTWQKMSWS